MTFPANFVWGAASSAYQVEGGWNADGKGPNNWDAFCHERVAQGFTGALPWQVFTPGNVYLNQTGDVACDHYHRFREDVGLMKQIGLKAYRLSINWSRVIPDGTGKVNEAGLAFYDQLVDVLLGAGIKPWVTLFHWDVPLTLWRRGSWLNREMGGWFEEYSKVIVDRLSDRVTHWMTINEPQIFLGPSEHEGLQTSNARASHAQRLLAAHNCMLSHGRAVQVIRARAKSPAQVGWAPIGRVKVPVLGPDGKARKEDIEAARQGTLGVLKKDFWNNTWFADPVLRGHYPVDGLKLYHEDLIASPSVKAVIEDGADLKVIHQPLDFYGINVYDGERFRMNEQGQPERVEFPPGQARTAVGWFVEPESLYWGPRFLYERYKVPMVITENGISNTDWVDMDGRVRDPQRVDYTRRYLAALGRAIGDGADVRGYFHWSIMDNFEWQSGYKERFGLIHIDYQTLKRTLKDSAHWYKKVIHTNGESLAEPVA